MKIECCLAMSKQCRHDPERQSSLNITTWISWWNRWKLKKVDGRHHRSVIVDGIINNPRRYKQHACMSLSLWSWQISADNTSWLDPGKKNQKKQKQNKKTLHFSSKKGTKGKRSRTQRFPKLTPSSGFIFLVAQKSQCYYYGASKITTVC